MGNQKNHHQQQLCRKGYYNKECLEYMPLYLLLANALNGSIWTAYALIKLDVFMLISNGLGALSGFAQLILYMLATTVLPQNKGSGNASKPTEIELQA
ncbi:hypothetical protein Tsubulata_004719 [Turnera subulata]|uniref:Bidirectional sugar transporter SWEET n=1 Tax=Turnera subulata TaxID=218843 RepID=A0A9Q0FHC0_9ROSI|nr:hypothetical protein Tsubulata_004719 [Turnera subulata]